MAQSPYWTQPLPPQYNWGTAGFLNLTNHAAQQPAIFAQTQPNETWRVAPVVATYTNAAQKQTYINGALPEDRAQYQGGVAISTASPYYPSTKGGIGMVTSPLQNASQVSETGVNDWHTVGFLRQQGTVWVHDPAYTMDSQSRLPMIPGTSNVTRLLNSSGFGNVNMVQVQGFGSENEDCMGRSAQWVDNVLRVSGATAPFPAGTFAPGVQTEGWQVVKRY
jgi:hypothetical protein